MIIRQLDRDHSYSIMLDRLRKLREGDVIDMCRGTDRCPCLVIGVDDRTIEVVRLSGENVQAIALSARGKPTRIPPETLVFPSTPCEDMLFWNVVSIR